MTELTALSLTEASENIATGKTSSLELTEAMLRRIDTLNPRYRAYRTVSHDFAMQQAQQADADIAAGKTYGPLHGIPLAIKDIFDTKDIVTTYGSPSFADFKPQVDAHIIQRLYAAGAVVLGKLNMTEFANTEHNPGEAAPRNPWNMNHSPGISSSGSGVASACAMAYGTIGTDTGGSIRLPAAANGVVGLKPTYNLINLQGALPLAPSLDHIGPLAGSVGDVGLLLNALSNGNVKSHGAEESGRKLKIGVDMSYCQAYCDEESVAALAQTLAILKDIGHNIRGIDLALLIEICRLWVPFVAHEAWHIHKQLQQKHTIVYGTSFARLLELGKTISTDVIKQANALRMKTTQYIDEIFDHVDVIACLSAPGPAPQVLDGNMAEVASPETFLACTAPFNFSGHPTLSLPCGFSDNGLPLSLQLIAGHNKERTLLTLGQMYEKATPWHTMKPKIGF